MTIAVALTGRLSPRFTLDVAFEVPARGVTALLGSSGSGKTSVLRAVAGLDRLEGSVRFGDESWQDGRTFLRPHRRRLGYVFQGAGLLLHLSVRRNLDYARRRGRDGGDIEEIVALTGVAPLLDRMPARLSGGEAQRASIARALVGKPRLLLLDEPLSALDSDARSGLLAELEILFDRLAMPVVYVTHDAAEAARLATRTITLADGRIASIT
jgi:molybdate transport system ATP-binding protein